MSLDQICVGANTNKAIVSPKKLLKELGQLDTIIQKTYKKTSLRNLFTYFKASFDTSAMSESARIKYCIFYAYSGKGKKWDIEFANSSELTEKKDEAS